MLSREDSRRLAQLERQLLRDDPEFCIRMADGQFAGPTRRKRPPITLVMTAIVAWTASLILGLLGWWPAAVLAALCATAVVAGVVYKSRRRPRPSFF